MPDSIEQLTLSWYYLPVAIKKRLDALALLLQVLDANTIDIAEVDAMLVNEAPSLGDEVRSPGTPATTFRPFKDCRSLTATTPYHARPPPAAGVTTTTLLVVASLDEGRGSRYPAVRSAMRFRSSVTPEVVVE